MRGETDTSAIPRRGAIGVVVSEGERERAFRRARRHSLLVKALKAVLPATALVCLGYYGAALVVSSRLKSRDISASKVSIDPTNLTMADPRYSGFGKDGSEYKVHAKSAVSDLRMSAPVRLQTIDGEIVQTNGVVTRLNAVWGTYDQKKDLLELYDRIDVDATNGMNARLTRATVLAKESRIISPEPVYAETETGNIRANSMTLETKTRMAAFRDAVEVTLKTNQRSPGLGVAPKPDGRAFGLDANAGEPVTVQSQRLDVDDTKKTALFRDAVVARQGEARLEAPELDVLYKGRAGIVGQAQQEGQSPSPTDETKLKSIHARGGVTMTNKADRAESQTFDYDAESEQIALGGRVTMRQEPERTATADTVLLDQKADTALLAGAVVVTQGRNILKGERLAIDRKAGTAKLETPATEGRLAGRISTLFYQSQAGRTGAAKQKAGPTDAVQPLLGGLGANFKSDPNAPIDVEAATLDVNDRKHSALYLGNVVAKQGDFIVKTEEMTAWYSGETGLLAGRQAAPGGPAKSTGSGGSELKRIEARRGVVVTGTDDQQATGEWANFDVKANTIVMGGNVTVTQGKQLVRAPAGMRLVIDLGSGVTRFEAEPGAAQAKAGAQVSGAFSTSVAPSSNGTVGACPPGAVCKSGRLEAIFYPNQIKEKAKGKVDAAAGKDPDTAAAATEAARGLVKRLPGRAATSPSGAAAQP